MSRAGCRKEKDDDAGAIRAVLEAAFGRTTEADLVETLRADGDLVLGWVYEDAGEVLGYVAYSRVEVFRDARTAVAAVGLAPLAVVPDLQGEGIGSLLVIGSLGLLKQNGESLVFVLGDPAYYSRFRFTIMDGYVSRYAGPYFQALKLSPDAPDSGRVKYATAFDRL